MISPEVQTFLAENIDSAELLDVLMLIHRNPDERWTPEAVSNRVFTVPQAARDRLQQLVASGLIVESTESPGSFLLGVKDERDAAALNALRAAYDESRAEVINVVFSMKADPLKSFSNAFKLRGDS